MRSLREFIIQDTFPKTHPISVSSRCTGDPYFRSTWVFCLQKPKVTLECVISWGPPAEPELSDSERFHRFLPSESWSFSDQDTRCTSIGTESGRFSPEEKWDI